MTEVSKKKDAEPGIKEQMQKYKKGMDRMFYIFFGILFSFVFLETTMAFVPVMSVLTRPLLALPGDLIEPIYMSIISLRFLIAIPAIYTLFFEVKDKKRRIVLLVLLLIGWFYAIYWRKDNDYTIFTLLLLVVAAQGKDFKKIGRIAIISAGIITAGAFLLSQVGVIEDLTYYRPGSDRARHSFGSIYCTDLAAHFLYMILLYMMLKKGKLRLPAYAVLILLVVLNILFVDAEISLFCTCVAILGCAFYALWQKKGWKLSEKLEKLWGWLLLLSHILAAAVMFLLAITYSDDPNIFYNKYYSLQNRIFTNYRLLKVIPFSWFGESFAQIGYGGTEEAPAYYFFVDCSYTRIYAMYGIVGFLVVMGLITYVMYRLKKEKLYFPMFILAVLAMDCMMEHHMIDMSDNVFYLLAFAEIGCLKAGDGGKDTEVEEQTGKQQKVSEGVEISEK